MPPGAAGVARHASSWEAPAPCRLHAASTRHFVPAKMTVHHRSADTRSAMIFAMASRCGAPRSYVATPHGSDNCGIAVVRRSRRLKSTSLRGARRRAANIRMLPLPIQGGQIDIAGVYVLSSASLRRIPWSMPPPPPRTTSRMPATPRAAFNARCHVATRHHTNRYQPPPPSPSTVFTAMRGPSAASVRCVVDDEPHASRRHSNTPRLRANNVSQRLACAPVCCSKIQPARRLRRLTHPTPTRPPPSQSSRRLVLYRRRRHHPRVASGKVTPYGYTAPRGPPAHRHRSSIGPA